jgi:lactate permease
MIPRGAMSSGMLLAAAYVGITPNELGVAVAPPVAVMSFVWLALYWRTAHAAGIHASVREHVSEAAWVLAGVALVAVATHFLGPEIALLSAYGPLIVIRFLVDRRPTAQQFVQTARQAIPYVAVIGGIALVKAIPALRQTLAAAAQLHPFSDLPAFSPLVHAGVWFLAGAIVTAAARGSLDRLAGEFAAAWRSGKQAVLTLFLFAMMAEVLGIAGISRAMADGLFAAMRSGAVIVTPVLSGFLGILTNTGNAPNSLFLPSLVALAKTAGLSVPAVAAIQHMAGMSLGFFSPVRMSIAANLAGGSGQEREVYRYLLPYAAAGFGVVIAGAWLAT